MHQYKTGVAYEVTNKDFDSAWVEAKHHKSNVHLEHVFGAGMRVHVYSAVWLVQYARRVHAVVSSGMHLECILDSGARHR